MPDISERKTKEKAFSDSLYRIFRKHQDRVIAAGSAAINWEEFKREVQDEIEKRVIAVFIIAAILFMLVEKRTRRDARDEAEPKRADFDVAAAAFAARRAASAAQRIIDTTRDRVAKVGQEISRLPTMEVQKSELKNKTDGVFGRGRADSVSATITTEAISAGEHESRRRLELSTGNRRRAFWITQRDERVCPICGPLHLRPEEEWGPQYPEGPPAHPRCRCFLLYRQVTNAA